MNDRLYEIINQCFIGTTDGKLSELNTVKNVEKFAELILANADELKCMMNTDPINKPFELNPKFVAKCDEIGRSRRQFQ